MSVRRLTFVSCFAAIALLACHHARGVGFVRDDMPPGQPLFQPGTAEGYWVWNDAQGWHLRTTSDVRRRFHGNVEALGGSPSNVRPVGRATGAVRQDGSVIEFNYAGSGGEQGFDWAGPGCQRFELYIDGTTRPLRVFLGGIERSPARVPFAVCS